MNQPIPNESEQPAREPSDAELAADVREAIRWCGYTPEGKRGSRLELAAQRLEANPSTSAQEISEARIDHVAEVLRSRGLVLNLGDVRAILEAVLNGKEE